MGEPLSNTHADLAERLRVVVAAAAAAERTATERSIQAGQILSQARADIPRGQWSPFLRRAGVHERQARRLIQLSRCALTPDMMSDLGGIGATLEWLSRWPALATDDCLIIWRSDHPVTASFMPVAIAWPRDNNLIDLGSWLIPEVFGWFGRGIRAHGLPLLSCGLLNAKRPSHLGWKTLCGEGPQWRETLGPIEWGGSA